ncbi:unnamed protein product [Paramecium primaurelia]|uniref:NET domain-containing protein n=1 Tax=Paramecium primaurelia TaxID=5886 RepID=A0A8S1NLR5_PARPR|nr:unnamed protein product [Paramecium primaurelia]
MASPIDFNLNQMQVEFILGKMPKGFSLLQASLLKAREQRVVRNGSLISLQSKKVNKYDASFQSNKQEVVEDKTKRIQRLTSTQQKESNKPLMDDNHKEGLQLLQMFKSHPAYTQIDTQGQINIDKIEAFFIQEGNLINLKNQIKQILHKLTQNASNQMQDLLNQLEIHFQNVFKSPSNQSKTTPIQNQNTLNKNIPQKSKEIQSTKKSDQIITFEEKKQLSQNIRELSSDYLKGVWEIVQQNVQTKEDEELEFDIDVLPPKIIRKLQEYVKNKLKTKKVKIDTSINQSSQRSLNQDSSFASKSFE